jgi:hypothetical protein
MLADGHKTPNKEVTGYANSVPSHGNKNPVKSGTYPRKVLTLPGLVHYSVNE